MELIDLVVITQTGSEMRLRVQQVVSIDGKPFDSIDQSELQQLRDSVNQLQGAVNVIMNAMFSDAEDDA